AGSAVPAISPSLDGPPSLPRWRRSRPPTWRSHPRCCPSGEGGPRQREALARPRWRACWQWRSLRSPQRCRCAGRPGAPLRGPPRAVLACWRPRPARGRRTDGTNNGGSNLAETAAVTGSAEDCCASCLQESDCRGYTWVKGSGECWLKSSLGSSEADGSVVSGSVALAVAAASGPAPSAAAPAPAVASAEGHAAHGPAAAGRSKEAAAPAKRRRPVAPTEAPAGAEQLPWAEANTNDGHLSDSRAAVLLGKTLRARVDVSQVGCGCVAGFFLYEGPQEPYCDASGSWPGKVERCGEIDLFEGNKHSWHSTLHNKLDHPGQQGGFGGMQQEDMTYGAGPRDMSGAHYGPGGSIVDTESPFNVAISFPKGPDGSLVDFVVMLYQDGKDQAIEWRVNKKREREGMDCTRECDNCFSKAGCVYGQDDLDTFAGMLSAGMTVQSTWWSTDEPWLDGVLDEEEGGCKVDPGQEGQESYGTYKVAHGECDGKSYSVDSWTLEDVQDPGEDWAAVLEAMDASPVVSKS
ncbi:unnamed protein product, partial [Prorocentrum cordatum]